MRPKTSTACPVMTCRGCGESYPTCHMRCVSVPCGCESSLCYPCRGWALDDANRHADCCEVWR